MSKRRRESEPFEVWYPHAEHACDRDNVHYHHVRVGDLTPEAAMYLGGPSGTMNLAPGVLITLPHSLLRPTEPSPSPGFLGVVNGALDDAFEALAAAFSSLPFIQDPDAASLAAITSCFIIPGIDTVVFRPVGAALERCRAWTTRMTSRITPETWKHVMAQVSDEAARQYSGLVPMSATSRHLCLATLLNRLFEVLDQQGLPAVLDTVTTKPYARVAAKVAPAAARAEPVSVTASFPALPKPWLYCLKHPAGRPVFVNQETRVVREAHDPPAGMRAVPTQPPLGWRFACDATDKLQLYSITDGQLVHVNV